MFNPYTTGGYNNPFDTENEKGFLKGLSALSSLTGISPEVLAERGQEVAQAQPEVVTAVTQKVAQTPAADPDADRDNDSSPAGDTDKDASSAEDKDGDMVQAAIRAALQHPTMSGRGVAANPEIQGLRDQAEAQSYQQMINGGSYGGWDAVRDIAPGALTALAALATKGGDKAAAMGQISQAIAQQIAGNAEQRNKRQQIVTQQAQQISNARANEAQAGLRDPVGQALKDKAEIALRFQQNKTNEENAKSTGLLRNIQTVRAQLEVEDKDPNSGLNTLRLENYNQDLARLDLKDPDGNPIQIPRGVRPEEYIKNSPLLDEATKTQLLSKSEAIRDDYAAKQVGRQVWAAGASAEQSVIGHERGLQTTSGGRIEREQNEGKLTDHQRVNLEEQNKLALGKPFRDNFISASEEVIKSGLSGWDAALGPAGNTAAMSAMKSAAIQFLKATNPTAEPNESAIQATIAGWAPTGASKEEVIQNMRRAQSQVDAYGAPRSNPLPPPSQGQPKSDWRSKWGSR